MEASPFVRILLVEDSEVDALMLCNHMKAEGLAFDLTLIEDLPSLRKALQEPGWDILLTDFDLPTTNGLEVISEAGRIKPDLPCILVSGKIGEEAAVEGLHAGAKDFVSKFKLARLLPAIQREIRLREQSLAAKAELQTAEDRFRAITAATLDGIIMMDSSGRVSFWNQSAERIFGYTAAEAIGSDLHALIASKRYHAAIEKGLGGFVGTGKGPAIGRVTELEARRKDGTELSVEFSMAGLQEGGAWHAVGVVRDITERRGLEREQYEHLQFLRTLLETIPSPLYYEDMEGRVLGCNRALQSFLNLSADRILGQKSEHLLLGIAAGQPGRSERGLLASHDSRGTSFQITLPDGQVRHALFHRAPYCDADGRTAGHVATLLDITRLKETEESLRRSESLFSTINRHLVDLVAIIDRNGRRIYNSPSYQSVLGYSEEEMAALASETLLHPDDYERVHGALRDLMNGSPAERLEYRMRHKEGRWLHFESRAALIPDEDAGQVRALVVARNITERKEAEQNRAAMEVQLRQAQKLEAIGQLAAGIAHEINTPTQYIGDNATFLRDSFDESLQVMRRLRAHLEEIRALGGPGGQAAGKALDDLASTDLDYLGGEIPKAIQETLDGVGRISKIVKAMKDFSHPGGASKSLTDLHRAIESTITVSRNEWKYAANLVTDFDPDLPQVPCFPGEFNQVILNLIVNAAHAIELAKGGQDPDVLGQIIVRTRAGNGEVMVSVSDDGTGILPAVQARMFDPFYTTKPVGKGTGQGLSIVHAVIVEKHKGRVEVDSELGKGTTFRIYLPLDAASR